MDHELILSGWQGTTSGLRIDAETRRKVFLPFKDQLRMVHLFLPGHEAQPCFRLKQTFWTTCPEFRSAEIGKWMDARGDKPWPHRRPPKYRAELVVGNGDAAEVHIVETEAPDGMRQFETPAGCAGWDQVHGMTEGVQAELEQMFLQRAKLDVLLHGVGRTAQSEIAGDDKVRLDAQQRECQAQMTFHAGRALELAMHIVYACACDRIMGRSYPGIAQSKLGKDRASHSFSSLHGRILSDISDRNMRDAFEDVYQEALHKGITDLQVDGKSHGSYLFNDDLPFLVDNKRFVIDGAEMTLDHADWGNSLSSGEWEISEFQKLPFKTISEFLKKADAVYYADDADDIRGQRKNMRWAHYSARDHEYGRPYVVAGIKFFARLVKGVVGLSNQKWTWHPDFRRRWHERRRYNVGNTVRIHINQSFQGAVELPEMKSVEQMESFVQQTNDGKRFRTPDAFNNLHKKFLVQRKGKGNAAR